MIISPDDFLPLNENGEKLFSYENAIIAWDLAREKLELEADRLSSEETVYFFLMVGPSGSGKTTFANLISKDFYGINLKHVIFDATLTSGKSRIRLIQSIKKFIKEPRISYIVKFTSLNDCIFRNKIRKDKPPQPNELIRIQYERLFGNEIDFNLEKLYDRFKDEIETYKIHMIYSGGNNLK